MKKKILTYHIKSNIFGVWTDKTVHWISLDRTIKLIMMKIISHLWLVADWFCAPQLSLTPTFTLDWTSSLLTSPLVPLENTEISVLPVHPVCSILPGLLLLLLLASRWPSPRAASVPVFNNHVTQMFLFLPALPPCLWSGSYHSILTLWPCDCG